MATDWEFLHSVDLTRGPLCTGELLRTADYEEARPELLRLGRALKAARRTRLGPHFSLLFESRSSVWLQIHEELRWLSEPSRAQVEELLAQYNVLIGAEGELGASLFVDSTDPQVLEQCSTRWRLEDLQIALFLGGRVFRAHDCETRPSPLGPVSYLRFAPGLEIAQGVDRIQCRKPTFEEQLLSEEFSRTLHRDLDRTRERSRHRSTSPRVVSTEMSARLPG